jgi:hypothetical protein
LADGRRNLYLRVRVARFISRNAFIICVVKYIHHVDKLFKQVLQVLMTAVIFLCILISFLVTAF